MAKALIIIGLIMAGIGFSKIANARTIQITSPYDIQIAANTNETRIGTQLCVMKHDVLATPRLIKKGSSFIISEIREKSSSRQSVDITYDVASFDNEKAFQLECLNSEYDQDTLLFMLPFAHTEI